MEPAEVPHQVPVEAPTAPMEPVPAPLPRPPPAARTGPNVHCQAACMQAANVLAAEPGAYCASATMLPGYQPVQPPAWETLPACGQWCGAGGGWQQAPELPAISQMLMREADAWRALLGLHGSVLQLTRSLAHATTLEAGDPHRQFDEQHEASEQREAAYLASVSQLIAQSDLLVSEAVKIRGLRKAKAQAESAALRDIVRLHDDEVMAMGEALGRNSGMSIASATAELRQASQAMRTQIQQARALLAVTAERRSLGAIPQGAKVVMGVEDPNGDVRLYDVANVLEHVLQRGSLSEETLSAALWEGALPREEDQPPQRTFARRAADRQLQQQLVANAESGKRSGTQPLDAR